MVEFVSTKFVRDAQPFEIMRTHFEERPDFSIQIVRLGTMLECKPRLEYLQQQLATVGLVGVGRDFDSNGFLTVYCWF